MKGLIVVPYRDRADHLSQFLAHMDKNYPEFDICIVEQADEKGFNRGKLLNIGYLENDYDYYIFHDVDMLCQSDKSVYSFPKRPTHIATECSQFNYQMPYKNYFGGVSIFSKHQFFYVNGFTNEIFGWGLEDDLIQRDCMWKGLKIDSRRARFECLDHPKQNQNTPEYKANEDKFRKGRNPDDGLNGCKYEIISTENKDGVKFIKVKL